MRKIVSAKEAKRRFQWESSSGTAYQSASTNCGPTCVSMVAGFYNDNTPSIEATRRLVAPCCRGTTYGEQTRMLNARGVPSQLVNITSVKMLHALVDNDRRPVILAMLMSRVPYQYRGHNFIGWHAVVCITGVTRNGQRGFLINDPNFSPPGGIRPDPTGGSRFYPDSIIQYAFIDNFQHWAIVPNRPKKILLEFDKGAGVIRTQPKMGKDYWWGDARKSGIYHNNKLVAHLGKNFHYRDIVRDNKGNKYWKVHDFDRTLYVRKAMMHVL